MFRGWWRNAVDRLLERLDDVCRESLAFNGLAFPVFDRLSLISRHTAAVEHAPGKDSHAPAILKMPFVVVQEFERSGRMIRPPDGRLRVFVGHGFSLARAAQGVAQ